MSLSYTSGWCASLGGRVKHLPLAWHLTPTLVARPFYRWLGDAHPYLAGDRQRSRLYTQRLVCPVSSEDGDVGLEVATI